MKTGVEVDGGEDDGGDGSGGGWWWRRWVGDEDEDEGFDGALG